MLAAELLDKWSVQSWRPHRLLVAVSGGADSVALLLALSEVARHAELPQDRLAVAHFNHHWRGTASLGDQLFVAQLASRLGHRCITNATPTNGGWSNQIDSPESRELAMLATAGAAILLEASQGSPAVARTEEAARRARYGFLIQAAYHLGAGYVVTAHTADDRAETLLHNLMRGSGLAGAGSLSSLRPLDEQLMLVRPLLTKSRQQILEFLRAHGQAWREDQSNLDLAYGRNFIRQQLMPAMQLRYPHARQNLVTFAELAEQTRRDLERLADAWLDRINAEVSRLRALSDSPLTRWPAGQYLVVPRDLVEGQVWSVLREALRQVWLNRNWPLSDMDRSHWDRLRRSLMTGQPSDPIAGPVTLFHLPAGLEVIRHGDLIVIGHCSNPADPAVS